MKKLKSGCTGRSHKHRCSARCFLQYVRIGGDAGAPPPIFSCCFNGGSSLPCSLPSLPASKGGKRHLGCATHSTLTSLPVVSLGYKVFSITGSVILRITHLGPKNLPQKKKQQRGNTSLGVLSGPRARAAAAMAWATLAGPAHVGTGTSGLLVTALQ